MRRIVLSRLRLQWTRYVLIALCVAVSAAFATGSLMLGTTMTSSLVSTVSDTTRNADLVVTEDWSNSSGTIEETESDQATDPTDPSSVYGADSLSVGSMEALEDIDGVRSVWVQSSVVSEATGPDAPQTLAVADAPQDHGLFPWELDEGSLPEGPGQIALGSSSAEELGAGVGDTLTLPPESYADQGVDLEGMPTGDPVELEVSGLVSDASTTGAISAWVDPQDLSALSPFPIQQLPSSGMAQISLEDGADAEAVRGEIRQRLDDMQSPVPLLLQTPQEQTQQMLEEMSGASAGISSFLLAFALLAVLVAFLVITTTFGVLTAQRSRELALLRCLGATGRQLQRSVILEALVLGVVASVLGVAAVVAAGFGIGALLPDTVPVSVAVAPKDIAAGAGIGIVVTILASLGPARRAMGASPLDGMRGSRRAERIPRIRTGLGLVLLLGCAAALTWAAVVHNRPVVGILSGIGCGVGLILTARLWMPAIVAALGRVLPGGIPSHLAAANASRHKSRTTTTATALLIGITLVTTVLTGHAVAQKSVLDDLEVSRPVDVTVQGPVDAETRAQIEGIEHVVSVEERGDALEVDLERGLGGQDTTAAVDEIAQLTETDMYEIGMNAIEKSGFVDILNVLLWVALGLLAAAVMVSVLGITSTMSLSVLERTRENSLLRALGLSRRQLGAMIRREALIISAAAAVAGVAAGWLLGTGVVSAMVTDSIPVAITVPWVGLIAVAVGVWLVALLSSAIPARRATRVVPVEGLASLD